MAAKQQKLEIEIPEGYSASERRAIADELIDVMIDQAKSGRGIALEEPGIADRRKRFPGYSETYVNSLDFNIAGKSKGSVDLTLSGDMLGAIQLLDHEDGKLIIGFEPGSENDRAEGNILGTYGQDTPNPSKARNFLGVTRGELKQVLAQFPVDDPFKAKGAAVTLEDLIELELED
jgi:hypothetical protein